MFSPLKRIFSGLMMLIGGCYLLWQAIDATNRNHRLEANPHERARVESTWTSSGRHSARYADLSFVNPLGGPLCHAKQVRLGSSYVRASVGQWIDVVPIPGSCDADAPTAATVGWALALQYLMAFFIFAGGMMNLAGLPMPFERLRAPA
jgi:hypothetical protein